MADFDIVENFTNSTFGEKLGPSAFAITFEIIFVFLCSLGLCLDTGIIYTIFRFKKLQTVPNIFVANWTIANFFCLIFAPSRFRLLESLETKATSILFYDIVYVTDEIMSDIIVLFLAVVLVDWCLLTYFPVASDKFRKHYKYVIMPIWISSLLYLAIAVGLSLQQIYFRLSVLFLFVFYLLLFVFMVVLQTLRGIQVYRKRQFNHPTLTLHLSTGLIILWFVIWLRTLLEGFKSLYPLPECVIFITSVITFLAFFYGNSNFQACFRQALKCSNNRYENQLGETPEVAEEAANGNAPAYVSFQQDEAQEGRTRLT